MSPPSLDDDALSADLDGEAGDDVRRQIADDPTAQARQADLHAAADAIGEPVPPLSAEVVDDLVASAIAGGSEQEPVDEGADEPVGGAVPLSSHRAPRTRGAGPRRWLVAAAVVALAAIGLGFIRSGINQDREQDTATPGADVDRDAGSSGAGEAQQDAAEAPPQDSAAGGGLHGDLGEEPGDEPPTTIDRFTSIPELGAYETEADLRNALRTSIPAAESRTSDAGVLDAANRCAVTVENQFQTEQAASAATATLADRPVVIYELQSTPPGGSTAVDLVVAVDREACTPAMSFYRDR